jgi:hypothetical protein
MKAIQRLRTPAMLRISALLLIPTLLAACGTLDIHVEIPGEVGGADMVTVEVATAECTLPTPPARTPTVTPVDYDPWTAEAAFTPVPAGEYPAPAGLRVACVRDDQLWLWAAETKEGLTAHPREGVGLASTSRTNGQVKVSGDGAVVAFRRGNDLWAVNSDGSEERKLLNLGELDASEASDPGVSVNRLEWVPGTHTLAFNTRLNLAFGLVLNDDLHLVDADTLERTALLPAGEGGEFYFSPDGSRIAIVTPGEISLVDAQGGQRERVLTYTPVNTGSEYRFYARPFWAPDGSTLRVAIPPADPFVRPTQRTSIWHIPTDGSPAQMLTSIDAAPLLSSDSIAFSTDLEYVAYAQIRWAEGVPPAQAEPRLEVQELASGGRVTYAHTGDLIRWAPNSRLFAFIAGRYEPRLHIGQWSGPTIPGAVDPGTDVFDVRWVDAEHYLFVARSRDERGPAQDGWDLVLADIHGSSTILASMGSWPHYDFTTTWSAALLEPAGTPTRPTEAAPGQSPTPHASWEAAGGPQETVEQPGPGSPGEEALVGEAPCQLSPLQVPIAVPWTPTADMLCLQRRDPESGEVARILDYYADDDSFSPGEEVTVGWQADGGQMMLLEIYDSSQVRAAKEGRAASVPLLSLFENLPLTGEHTVAMPEDLVGDVRLVFWVASRGPVGSPVVMHKRLAFAVLDLPQRAR